ncbi:MFS transporter [Novosphingobium sp.]|uniref:MFS transporter n=1 Tax=Novosphingobium sp. TaxID=1874826 RepID=UPI0033420285
MPDNATTPARLPPALWLILVIVFINFAGFSLIIPLLPFYGHALHASPVAVTLLFAAYSFGGIFGELWWGRLSDRIGRRPVLIGATAATALSYVAFAFVPNLALALVVRVATGFFSGTVGVCQSVIADVTRPEDRARSIGLLGAALNLGFAIGPAIGGLLATPELGLAGFRLPILGSALVAAGASAWSLLVLVESHPPGVARALPKWGEALHHVAGDPLLARLFAIAFIGIGAFASMEAVFGLWTAHNFGWSAHDVGLTFVAVGLTGFTAQIMLIGRATRRWGEARVVMGGLVVLALSMLLQPVLRNPVAAVVLMSTLMAGHSIAFPSAGALISRSTAANVQGSVNGLLMASNALGRIAVPPLFGAIYAGVGPDWPYYAGTVLAGVALLIGARVVGLRDMALKETVA